jgi:hypothetical protein
MTTKDAGSEVGHTPPLTTSNAFEAAYAAFAPAPDDNPAAVPAYRAFHALNAVWGESFGRQFNATWHRAACEASWAQEGERYKAALSAARDWVASAVPPPEPRPCYSYASEPKAPTDADVIAAVRREFKLAYPGKRWGSAFAKAALARVRDQAHKLLLARFVADVVKYEASETGRKASDATRHQAWLDTLHSMALLEDAVRKLPE